MRPLLALTGTGTTPTPVLTASTNLLFSNVPIGNVSASRTITVNAYQNHPIQASLTSTFTGGPQPFIFTGPTFCPSAPCTLGIAYAPTSAPSGQSANVYLVATDTVGLSSGNIQAYGQVHPLAYIDFSPMNLTFPPQALNTVSAPQTVTITNSGIAVLTLSFAVDPLGEDYFLANNCPASLAIGASCSVDVRLAPVDSVGPTNLIISGSNVARYVALNGSSF